MFVVFSISSPSSSVIQHREAAGIFANDQCCCHPQVAEADLLMIEAKTTPPPGKRRRLASPNAEELPNGDALEVHLVHTHLEETFLGSYTFADDSASYIGELSEGKASGHGILQFSSGDEYEGEFRQGKFHGWGCYRYSTGEVYTGEWMEDMKHGDGVFEFADGSRYEGRFERDAMHGYGVRSFANGDEYKGWYANGMKSGEGVYRQCSSSVFEGNFIYDMRNGFGVTTFSNGDVHRGEYQHDRMHGMGTYIYANGHVFKGQFLNGSQCRHGYYCSPSGVAVYVYENGNLYRGEMKEDSSRSVLFTREGRGTTRYTDGAVMTGFWKDDRPHGVCSMRLSNGDIFQGEYWCGKRKGRGVLSIASSGNRVEGVWEDNKLVLDQVTLRYSNGNVWEGPLRKVNGEYLRHGRGSLTYADDGRVVTAIWEDDNLMETNDGRIKLSDGTSLKGRLSSSEQFEGNVVVHYVDRSSYRGGVKNLKRHGRGKLTFDNGDSFTGGEHSSMDDSLICFKEFISDKRHGRGTLDRGGDVINGGSVIAMILISHLRCINLRIRK